MKRICIFALVLSVALAFYSCSNGKTNNSEVKSIINEFSKAMIEGTFENAIKVCTGEVKYNIENNEQEIHGFKFINVDTTIETNNSNYAAAHASIEYENQGVVDVTFYKIYLVKKENKTLIYKIEEEDPAVIEGESSNKNEEDIKKIFQEYMKAIEDKNYTDGGKYLIGRARKNHIMTQEFIKKADLVKDIKNIKLENILTNSKISIDKVEYENQGRKINILLSSYKTGQGWRIYNVSQI